MAEYRVPGGHGWEDGGVMDFGREHIYRDMVGDIVVLPDTLVKFIEQQAKQRSEQHGPGAAAGDAGDHHRQAGAG